MGVRPSGERVLERKKGRGRGQSPRGFRGGKDAKIWWFGGGGEVGRFACARRKWEWGQGSITGSHKFLAGKTNLNEGGLFDRHGGKYTEKTSDRAGRELNKQPKREKDRRGLSEEEKLTGNLPSFLFPKKRNE